MTAAGYDGHRLGWAAKLGNLRKFTECDSGDQLTLFGNAHRNLHRGPTS